jgi:hypothetical protein
MAVPGAIGNAVRLPQPARSAILTEGPETSSTRTMYALTPEGIVQLVEENWAALRPN